MRLAAVGIGPEHAVVGDIADRAVGEGLRPVRTRRTGQTIQGVINEALVGADVGAGRGVAHRAGDVVEVAGAVVGVAEVLQQRGGARGPGLERGQAQVLRRVRPIRDQAVAVGEATHLPGGVVVGEGAVAACCPQVAFDELAHCESDLGYCK